MRLIAPRPATALLAIALFAGLAEVAAADHASRVYDFRGKPTLDLSADDGRVRFHVGPAGRISIEVETVGWSIGPAGLRLTDSQQGSRIEFAARGPHFRWFGFGHRGVTIDVTVPREIDLVAHTGDGSVTVDDLEGDLEIRTGDGNVQATGLRGDLRLETGDGTVMATGLDGRLTARTGDGRLRVEGRFDRLDIGTGDGPVEAEAVERSSVAEEWHLTTGDGPLVLRLPAGLAADLDAFTGDGHVSTDLPIEVRGTMRGGRLSGRLNGGGGRMVLRTGDGSIRIERR
jgi:putative adhesin